MPAFFDRLLADPWGLFFVFWCLVVTGLVIQGGVVSAVRAIRKGIFDA